MTSFPSRNRAEIEKLCSDIDRLLEYYERLPPCYTQNVVVDLVNMKIDKINQLWRPGLLENAKARQMTAGAAGVATLIGLMSGTYVLFALGIGMVGALLFTQGQSTPPIEEHLHRWDPEVQGRPLGAPGAHEHHPMDPPGSYAPWVRPGGWPDFPGKPSSCRNAGAPSAVWPIYFLDEESFPPRRSCGH